VRVYLKEIGRVPLLTGPEEVALAGKAREQLALYRKNEDLVSIGAYQKGSDPRVDEAIALWPVLSAFLQQETGEAVDLDTALRTLTEVLGDGTGDGSAA